MPKGITTKVVDGRKRCGVCGEMKALDEFYKSTQSTGGRMSSCKICACAYSETWRKNNHDRHLEAERARRERNRYHYKAVHTRGAMFRSLRRLNRPPEPVASTAHLEATLRAWYARLGLPLGKEADVFPHIDNCHRISLRDGGSCSADNIFWGWGALNKRLGWAPIDLQLRMVRDYLAEIERTACVESRSA